jgi:hypothetical protein
MQYRFFFIITFIGVILQLVSAQSKEINVVMRQIGHKVLLSSGDDTSRVMPITHNGANVFLISFEKPLQLSSDSIYHIVAKKLKAFGIYDFVVELKDCKSEEVLYSFLFNQSKDTITPCGGRNLPFGCYVIEIELLKVGINIWWWSMSLFVLSSAFYLYWRKRRTDKLIDSEDHSVVDLGSYKFDIQNRQLLHINRKESLTEKEAKLLLLLHARQNELQNRDFLMQELWAESGVMVVSKNLDVLVSKLRKKLILDENIKITNVHGVGYKLEICE